MVAWRPEFVYYCSIALILKVFFCPEERKSRFVLGHVSRYRSEFRPEIRPFE